MAKTAKQAFRGAKQLFRWCLIDGSLDERRTRQVMVGVLQSRRRGYAKVLAQFYRLVKLERDRRTARIESAIPLSPDLKDLVRTQLESSYGAGITALFAQNTDLIGGLRIQVGNDVYDGSVREKLAALRRSFGIME